MVSKREGDEGNGRGEGEVCWRMGGREYWRMEWVAGGRKGVLGNGTGWKGAGKVEWYVGRIINRKEALLEDRIRGIFFF